MLDAHRELLATELNVKSVEVLAAEQRRDLVLDYAKLGRRLRDKVKSVAPAVAAALVETVGTSTVELAGTSVELALGRS